MIKQEIEDRIWIMDGLGIDASYIANHFNIPFFKAIIILDELCTEVDEIVNIGGEYFWQDLNVNLVY